MCVCVLTISDFPLKPLFIRLLWVENSLLLCMNLKIGDKKYVSVMIACRVNYISPAPQAIKTPG